MDAVSPGTRLAGRYVVEELIATGGMATVWRARDEVLGRTVAVKVLRDDLAGDPEFRERFRREAVAAARLSHPAIINIFDTGTDGRVVFIVMEFFDGRTLAAVARDGSPLHPERAVELVIPVLEGLGFAHARGVVHRDVKPANILVADDGRVKVTDFGIAKAVLAGRDLTTTGNVLGTAQYLSPEQVQGSAVDARSDIYSLGAVLYELLTGRPPFDAENAVATAMMRLTRNPVPPRDIRPGIPRDVEAVALRALARRPEDRFPTAEAMRDALGHRRTAAPVTAPRGIRPAESTAASGRGLAATRWPAVARGSVFRSWMLVPLVAVALAAAAIAVGLAIGGLEFGGPLGVRRNPDRSGGANAGAAVRIVSVRDHDPFGDGSEHSADAPLAADGDQGTAWTTDHYSSAQFGRLKPGLGLWVGFGRSVQVGRVTVSSPLTRWAFELLPGAQPNENADPLPSTGGAVSFTIGADGTAVVDLGGVKVAGLMIWITRLAPDGGRYAASIAEITVRAAG
jgi:tRNA A-37 threonylcarbamoyl transferase component Bud32